MLHADTACLDQIDAVLQRRVHCVGGLTRKISEIVQAGQPVTFLSQVAVVAAIAGAIEKPVVQATLATDIFQYQQSWIRKCLK